MVSIPELDPDLEEIDCTYKPVYSMQLIHNSRSTNPWIQVDLEENLEVHAINRMTTCTNTLSQIQTNLHETTLQRYLPKYRNTI